MLANAKMSEGAKPKRKHRSYRDRWTTFDYVVTLIALIVCFICFYPMWYVVCLSISDPVMAASGRVSFWPMGFTTTSYTMIASNLNFWVAFRNSIGYVIVNCILMLLTTICVAYPLTRPDLKFRKLVTYYLLVPMYFGGGMIPSFLVVTKMGLYNHPLSLILPSCYGIWNIILCRTYMASIPHDLSEAAMIDGANVFKVLTKIIVPLSKPVLAVIMIYTVVGVWNSWFSASIYITHREYQPVQLYLRNLINSAATIAKDLEENMSAEMWELYQQQLMSARQLQYSMIVIVTLPILMVYPIFQKHFTKGIMLGSLKG